MKSVLTLIALSLALVPVMVMAQTPAQMPDMGQMFLQQFDANKDGRVTQAEYLKPSQQQFAFMDANRDGAISAAEASNFAQQMMQRMQQQIQQQGQQAPQR